MLKRKGISSVLGVGLIVLGTVIGVTLLWAFVVKTTDRSNEVVDPDCLTLNLELMDCKAYGSCSYQFGTPGYNADILVNRKVGSGNVTGLRFIFEDAYGFKRTYDKELDPPLNELESLRFQGGQRIPVAGLPHIVRVVAMLGKNKDVCPIMSNSKTCPIVEQPPIIGSIRQNNQCCQQPPNMSECYNGKDINYPVTPSGFMAVTILNPNGYLPYQNKSICCGAHLP